MQSVLLFFLLGYGIQDPQGWNLAGWLAEVSHKQSILDMEFQQPLKLLFHLKRQNCTEPLYTKLYTRMVQETF